MSRFHNNQLNMVSLFDEEPTTPTHKPNRKRTRNMPAPQCHSKALLDHGGPLETYRGPEVDNSYVHYGYERDMYQRGEYHAVRGHVAPAPAPINNNGSVSYTPTCDSDYAESDGEDHPPSKIPKINKDGAPRKPRQPRPKLLKWSDDDWKNVVLGIVWACGETGVQIPFDQAAQVVGKSCTAGALQQAILKLRGKQIDEGYQIPSLRMAWTRKNKRSSSLSSTANTNSQASSGQDPLTHSRPSLIVKLKVLVSNSVVVKHSPGFNKAGADCVHEESKEKEEVLNHRQDQKFGEPDGDVFTFDSTSAQNNDSHGDFKINGSAGYHLPLNGNVPKGGQGFGIAIDRKSPPDKSSGYGRDIVPQRMPTRNNAQAYLEAYGTNGDDRGGEMDSIDLGDDFDHAENDEAALLGHPRRAFLPEMSPSVGHAYESPYSFSSQEDPVHLRSPLFFASGQREAQGFLGLESSPQDGPPLDAGPFPDLFPHDVFPNCGFTQGSFVDVPMAEAHEDYGFNAGHYN
ncbi:hypothetical protein BKA58DRAFT_460471 [Alternaria rosae]|uniref:uncharacterized protein n=1 Tax=Alternaria rosae TaxID=1187941 RepID=UPI001E8D7A20|nr:uncharacterized protein BKA58DRAFT_460471 [Alternaria rosae]KAH6866657.1 hypothetical protein BKA58DRAFT_460471 [Alternaria rosae]